MAAKQKRETNSSEQIQLLTLKPKHHNPIPKTVITNRPDSLTPDILWGDSITKCFLYSCIAVFIIICIIIIHGIMTPNTTSSSSSSSSSPPSTTNNKNHIITDTNNNNNNPHIIWFIIDDLGHSDFSYHSSEYDTPNIDSIALNGIELKQHYVSPICSATRSSLLTGTYSYKMGLQGVLMDYIHPTTISHIPIKYDTIANYLNKINYNNKIYGKWHAGYSKQSYTPLHRGFNTHIGYYQYAIDPFTKYNLDAWRNAHDWFVNGEYVPNTETQYSSDLILDSVKNDLDLYNSETDDPLFMYIAFSNPHFPIKTPDTFNTNNIDKCSHIQDTDRQKYCLSVVYLDNAIGEILDSLKSNNMYDNTLIALTVDNGAQIKGLCGDPGDHIAAGSVYPLRGGKYTLFQGGVLTPAFISGNLIDKQYYGTKTNQMISSVDWLPTLLHFTNYYDDIDDIDDIDGIDGIDQYNNIFDENDNGDIAINISPRKYLILSMEYDDKTQKYLNTAIIYNNHKLMIGNQLIHFNHKSCDVRSPKPGTDDFKAVVNDITHTPYLMLFDLENDPNEFDQLLNTKHTDKYKNMIEEMMDMLDNERINNVDEIRVQWFESESGDIPIDAYSIDDAHQPWQNDEEDEFPDGFNY